VLRIELKNWAIVLVVSKRVSRANLDSSKIFQRVMRAWHGEMPKAP
jgi:hypothetical protein